MTSRDIAARLQARPTARGWIACCPAHADARASLSIASAPDGRVLLHCFAGCDFEEIARALGLEPRDLFSASAPLPIACARRAPTANELCEALRKEARRFRAERGIIGLLLTAEINAIRMRVADIYGVKLPPVPVQLCEGSYGGYERDPAWPAIFDRAVRVASVEVLGLPLAYGQRVPPGVLIAAERIAAAAMRSMNTPTRTHVRQGALHE